MKGDVCYFLAGDTTYTQQALIDGHVDGVSPDEAVSLRTMQTILQLTKERPVVYLPSHDAESADRLSIGATVPNHAQV
jgi:glyoxylase-like metal-dependent hydrolase (beta-lactamase superfamily II)